MFNLFCCFLILYTNFSHTSDARISYYFPIKAKILADFQIYISVALNYFTRALNENNITYFLGFFLVFISRYCLLIYFDHSNSSDTFYKFNQIELYTLVTKSLRLNNEKVNKAVENLPSLTDSKSIFSYLSIWKQI